MRILYIGHNFGTSYHRYQALKRLGHDTFLVNPYWFMPSNRWTAKWIFETGGWGLATWIKIAVLKVVRNMHFDFVLVDGGELIGPELLKSLKTRFKCVTNYNHDDPFSPRYYRKWRLYRRSIPEYDLLTVVRDKNVNEVKSFGGKRVLRVFMSADELVHKQPLQVSSEDIAAWSSEVVFVGTWMPERGRFMVRLLQHSIPLSIWGDRWHKAREWRFIERVWRGPSVDGHDYVKIIQTSKICLGLLSKENRDLHTTRSVEIPAAKGLLCAQRTREHLAMYIENQEAVFWKDADECARVCHKLLKAPSQRLTIAQRGHERCLKNNYFHEPTLSLLIKRATEK